MVFSSIVFLFAFLPIIIILYYLNNNLKYKNILLGVASLVFYSFGQLYYVPLFICSILINYLSGVILKKQNTGRKFTLAAAVILNLGILAYYKYYDFAVSNINAVFGTNFSLLKTVLPIGISFFTFQGMSYVIDVYREPETGTYSFGEVFLYISFFPQLIAGPIVKYHDISAQISKRTFSTNDFTKGTQRFITGLAKKVLISNSLGYIVDSVFNQHIAICSELDFRLMWLMAICYTMQIYFDFSGYSDMAIGLSKMFGFSLLENFNFPYGADSIKDFWRKWHISLSSWFKEYLYIPLGGNRKGKTRTVINKFAVFFCTGIWHGANWTFIAWGLLHGTLSSLEEIGVIPVKKLQQSFFGKVICRVYTFMAVCLAFVIFRCDNISQAVRVIGGMFMFKCVDGAGYLAKSLLTPAVILIIVLSFLLSGKLAQKCRAALNGADVEQSVPLQISKCCAALILLILSTLSLAGSNFNPFIYFQF